MLIRSAMPIATSQYWYVSAYAGLFFVIPWLNKFVGACNKRESTLVIFIIALVFMIYGTFAYKYGDCFVTKAGYCFVWITMLYIVGAWMKKCDIPSKCGTKAMLLLMLGCILITWGVKVCPNVPDWNDTLLRYTSITVVFIAFALVCLFSKAEFGPNMKKAIKIFAPAAFGVYLIHAQPVSWNYLIPDAFTWIADYNWVVSIALVLACALCIFFVCLFIEKIRLVVFHYLRIDKFINYIATIICNFFRKMFKYFFNLAVLEK